MAWLTPLLSIMAVMLWEMLGLEPGGPVVSVEVVSVAKPVEPGTQSEEFVQMALAA